MIRWILKELWEKINIFHTYRAIKNLGKKYGKRFFITALIWEAIEDVVFPLLSWHFGVPGLIPVFLILHFEPIVYPIFFWAFRMWDRFQGKEPWDPNRSAHSHHWRSAVKVIIFQVATTGWLSHLMKWKMLIIFAILTGLFGFVHERIWNDSNYGILPNDTVQNKRVLSKTATYSLVTSFTLLSLLHVSKQTHLLRQFILAQLILTLLFLVLEKVWAKSMWGVHNPSLDK